MANKVTVYFYTFGDDENNIDEYEGDVNATATPTGELVVLRENRTKPNDVLALYSRGSWDRVLIGGDDDE
jgi:hypothetical protein